jgi:hypothetical protein
MTKITRYIAPAKFLSLSTHLILLLALVESYESNVDAGTDDESPDSTSKSDASSILLFGIALSLLFILTEVIIIFTGSTMFFDKSNMILLLLHGFGAVFTATFILESWRY